MYDLIKQLTDRAVEEMDKEQWNKLLILGEVLPEVK